MRDLLSEELEHVYGAGGQGCAPKRRRGKKCGSKSSKSSKSCKSSKSSKSSKSC